MSRRHSRVSVPLVVTIASVVMILMAFAVGEAQEVRLQNPLQQPSPSPVFDPFLLEL